MHLVSKYSLVRLTSFVMILCMTYSPGILPAQEPENIEGDQAFISLYQKWQRVLDAVEEDISSRQIRSDLIEKNRSDV